MRVVELNRDLVGERAPIGIAAAEAPDEIGQRAGDQEILLHEAQALSHVGGIVWIEHPGQRFGRESPSQGADKIAAAEFLKVEIVGRSGGPQAQCIDGLAAITDDWSIERNADQ